MMLTRKPLDGSAVGLMVVLCMIWGLQQVLFKIVAPDMAPTMQIALRSGVAATLVAIILYRRKELIIFSDGLWRPGAVAGLCYALEYLMVGEGLRYTTASHMVMFLYTAPVFAGLGLHLMLPEERLKPVQWLGIALAFSGVLITFSGRSVPTGGTGANMILGDIFGLLAGLAWGASTVVIRCTKLASISATRNVFYQLASAFLVLIVASVLLGQTYFNPTPMAWGCLVFQTLVVALASFLAWIWLLRHYLASRLGVISFMTPLFGITFGVIILNEPLETSFILGTTLVLGGIILVSGYDWFIKRPLKERL